MGTAEADLFAATLRSGSAQAKAGLLSVLVQQVRLHEDRVEVLVDVEAARQRLGLGESATVNAEPYTIIVEAVRVRRGHQLRLIVPGPEVARPKPARRDDKLIALVAEAQHARQLVLANLEYSLARIAREHGRCRSRLGKLVALSCLAPDIVTAIVEGKQPKHLTARRLLTKELPLTWPDQRQELDFS